ncbi:MAG TPA: cyclic nucleotide-binding domain-containing protein [Candidatus Dormibacteraeota bacterium]|nr:cyclic nucleotide-binding domain-containing protein [Candidatus Dormibacteraeota bacterium]
MEGLERLLAEHRFFRDLDPAYIELLSGCAANRRFNEGTYLFHEGDPADHFYLIRTGTVALEIAGSPRGPIILQTLGVGDMLGFSWLFPPYRMQFDARAVETVVAHVFDGACLRGKADADPRLGYELMKRFSRDLLQRLQATRLQILDVYGHAAAR